MAAKKKNEKEIQAKELDTVNIFTKGILVSLRTRLWGATGKLERSQFSIIDETMDKKTVHASMDLLKDKTLINAMRQTRAAAQRFVKANSLPFPEVGMDFVPKNRIQFIAEELEKYRTEYLEYGEQLVKKLKELEAQFAEKHPKLYNPAKYPSEARLRYTIQFEYVFRVFSAPDEALGVISPDMYQREIKKFRADIEMMKENTVGVICKEIKSRIDQLSDQCESGKVNQATLNGFETIMDKFKNVWTGFVDEKDVLKIMEDLELYLEGTDASMLRYDDEFRSMVGFKAKEIASTLENKGFKRSIDI
jgi:hypothetical protein